MLTLSRLTSSHETVLSLIHYIYQMYHIYQMSKTLIPDFCKKLCQKMKNKIKMNIKVQRIMDGDNR